MRLRLSRRTITLILLLLALPVVVVGYWLLAPLFITERVNEDFPPLASNTNTNAESAAAGEFPFAAKADLPEGMSMAQAEEMMIDAAAQDEPYDERAPDGMAMADDTMRVDAAVERVKTGEFRDADSFHRGSGTATIYRANGESVLRLEDFRVTNGPQLHVLLVPHADPMERADVDGHHDLGELKGNEGNQNYPLPPDIDAADYDSVVIYCKPFRVIFSVAPLIAPQS